MTTRLIQSGDLISGSTYGGQLSCCGLNDKPNLAEVADELFAETCLTLPGEYMRDYAALYNAPDPLDESKLMGDELALMISRLTIRNDGPISKTALYYIKLWKPAVGDLEFGPMPVSVKNTLETALRESYILAREGDSEFVVCFVDNHSRGSLSKETVTGAVRYSIKLNPGEEHVIHLATPGRMLPNAETEKLHNLPYDRLHDRTVQYWKARLAEGMLVEVPDRHMQNLCNASLHHFLLGLTKDGRRGEHYANIAVLYYGAAGSESSPIVQALDMRGLHGRAESCLKAWLSTQGDTAPDGDYVSKEGGFYHFYPMYTVNQGGVLWALAEHYLYTRDRAWLSRVAPQIVAGCDFILRERKRTMKELPDGRRSLSYGLAPAGRQADPWDWQYGFMLNGWFYLGLKKSAQVLRDVDPESARRIAAEAEDYLLAIRKALKESVAISPVARLRDNTSVPCVPSYLGLRGFRTDVKDAADLGYGQGYVYDSTLGPLHLLKCEVLEPDDREVSWMLNVLEDRFFMYSPGPSRVDLGHLSTDWFNLGGFEKLQPYYVHYQDAYLQRDQVLNFLRGFFNTLAAAADPETLTFMEGVNDGGGEPQKTHEEAWFFHQFRFMLLMEMGSDLFLARGTPREWLEHGKQIAVIRAPSYFGELSYRIRSFVEQGRIEATVNPPHRDQPTNLYLRLRHPNQAPLRRVTVNGRSWKDFNPGKEWIKLPKESNEVKVTAYY